MAETKPTHRAAGPALSSPSLGTARERDLTARSPAEDRALPCICAPTVGALRLYGPSPPLPFSWPSPSGPAASSSSWSHVSASVPFEYSDPMVILSSSPKTSVCTAQASRKHEHGQLAKLAKILAGRNVRALLRAIKKKTPSDAAGWHNFREA